MIISGVTNDDIGMLASLGLQWNEEVMFDNDALNKK